MLAGRVTHRLNVRKKEVDDVIVFQVVRRGINTQALVVLGEFWTPGDAYRYIGEVESRQALLSEENNE